jgi:hypothetical protein
MATYDINRRHLKPLKDEEAAKLLTRDAQIGREWRRLSAMRESGGLIVLNPARVQRALEPDPASDDVDELA